MLPTLALIFAISCLIFSISAWFLICFLLTEQLPVVLPFSLCPLLLFPWKNWNSWNPLTLNFSLNECYSSSCYFCKNVLMAVALHMHCSPKWTWPSISSNQSSSTALSSSSSNALYSSRMPRNILNRSLNWASSSSTATKFLVEKSRSSIVLHFLCNWALIFPLLSFRVLSLNDFSSFSQVIHSLCYSLHEHQQFHLLHQWTGCYNKYIHIYI